MLLGCEDKCECGSLYRQYRREKMLAKRNCKVGCICKPVQTASCSSSQGPDVFAATNYRSQCRVYDLLRLFQWDRCLWDRVSRVLARKTTKNDYVHFPWSIEASETAKQNYQEEAYTVLHGCFTSQVPREGPCMYTQATGSWQFYVRWRGLEQILKHWGPRR